MIALQAKSVHRHITVEAVKRRLAIATSRTTRAALGVVLKNLASIRTVFGSKSLIGGLELE